MATRRSIQRVVQRATRDEQRVLKAAAKTRTQDSFQNLALKLGLGTDNALSASTYGFNPVSRVHTLLEWIHRGSWIGGVAVDLVADDMTRAGVELKGQFQPDQSEAIEEAATTFGIWNAINETIKWARLYGGAIAVMLVDGQDPKTPLRLDTIGHDQFRGLLVLDRWMIEPSLNDLITEYGPDLGLPKYYRVTADAPALVRMTIHHSRCMRLEGVRLPYWQRLAENLWGISVLERLYDRMIAFDSATTGAAQLVYKSYLRGLKITGLREITAAGGEALDGIVRYVEMMRRFQGIEGLTLIDGDDEFAVQQHTAFGGIADALLQFGQQIAGALQIPLVRLFGQSPAGLNATGESDLRTYYDGIKQQQEKSLRVPVTRIYRALARSAGVALPQGFRIEFRPLWQLQEAERAEIAQKITQTVVEGLDSGIVTGRATGLKELRQASQVTGVWSNITDEDIDAAQAEPPPLGEALLPGGAAGAAPGALAGAPSVLSPETPVAGSTAIPGRRSRASQTPTRPAAQPPVWPQTGPDHARH